MQVTIILVPAKALASNPVSRRLQPRTPRLPACSPLLPPSPLKPLKLLKLLNLPKFLNLLKLLILSALMLPCHNFGAARALQRLFFAAVAALSSRAACALQHPLLPQFPSLQSFLLFPAQICFGSALQHPFCRSFSQLGALPKFLKLLNFLKLLILSALMLPCHNFSAAQALLHP